MPVYEFKCDACGTVIEEQMTIAEMEKTFWDRSHLAAPGKKTREFSDEVCGGHLALIPSLPRFNSEFPTQCGGVHSMAGFGKRSRNRQGD